MLQRFEMCQGKGRMNAEMETPLLRSDEENYISKSGNVRDGETKANIVIVKLISIFADSMNPR